MGTRRWHTARAEYHKRVADEIETKLHHTDWAVVALFYSALHHVHSMLNDEPDLLKDERHPRKHTAPAGAANGGRGTNQLVRDIYKPIHKQYRSLFEASHRTRYDMERLDGAYDRFLAQHADVERYARMIHTTRPERADP